MTAPHSPLKSADAPESIMDWFQLYSKQAAWGAVAIVAVAAAGWFYMQSQDLKTERAEKAYYSAQRSMAAGNIPLAESDLRKMIGRYKGTPAAMQGSLQLAQILYDQGKFQDGLNEMKRSEKDMESSEEFGSSVHLVMAAGLEQLKKHSEAAGQYEKAAKAARFDPDRQRYMSQAAMAYLTGGDTARAKAIWTDLGADSKGTVAGEARVRLGEIAAKAQPKS